MKNKDVEVLHKIIKYCDDIDLFTQTSHIKMCLCTLKIQ